MQRPLSDSTMHQLVQDFNQPLDWDVSSATSMVGTFKDAAAFNSDISHWNVTSVCNFTSFLDGAQSFEQDLSSWLPAIQASTCPSTPVATNMLKGTSCADTSNPDLTTGPICNQAAAVNPTTCLNTAFETMKCQCEHKNQCLQGLRQTCRAELKAAGITAAELRKAAKTIVNEACR